MFQAKESIFVGWYTIWIYFSIVDKIIFLADDRLPTSIGRTKLQHINQLHALPARKMNGYAKCMAIKANNKLVYMSARLNVSFRLKHKM